MKALFTAEQTRAADRYTIEQGTSALELMERAAKAVVDNVSAAFSENLSQTRGVILAGPGNNGGDALAVGRLLSDKGVSNVEIYLLEGKLSKETQAQKERLQKYAVRWTQSPDFKDCDWIIDGLFGTGLSRPLEGAVAALIGKLNARPRGHVFSIDIPSGLNADTGTALGAVVRANSTLTLGHYKRGLVTGEAFDWVGSLTLDNIGIPEEIPGIKPGAFLFMREDGKHLLPPRKASGHKGTYGHLYIWAGKEETEGAAALSCVAAFRSGVGLLTLISDRPLESLRHRLPIEVMSKQVTAKFFSDRNTEGTCVLGPGLGKGRPEREVVEAALKSSLPLVLDADGLTLVAEDSALQKLCRRSAPLILTPHPKEASRLLNVSVEEVQKDRYEACQQIVDRLGAVVLLKGKGTLIGAPDRPLVVVTAGDSSLSKAGTGDLLSGILGALLAQKVDAQGAAALGAYLHGRAAELLSKRLGTERAAMASEIADSLPAAWSELEKR